MATMKPKIRKEAIDQSNVDMLYRDPTAFGTGGSNPTDKMYRPGKKPKLSGGSTGLGKPTTKPIYNKGGM